jgi:hypothetical protein
MDNTQLIAFCNYAFGNRTVGTADGESVETPHSPELRAFLVARLGDNTPNYGYWLVHRQSDMKVAQQAKAFADLLREVADGIFPATTGTV